jgi:hypothetical protein
MNQIIDNIMELHDECMAVSAKPFSVRVAKKKALRAAIEQALKMEQLNYAGCMEDLKEAEKALGETNHLTHQPQPCNPAEDGVCEALECCTEFNPDWNQEQALRDSLRDHMAMIRADREVMRQALEALEQARSFSEGGTQKAQIAIAALRERL